MRTRIARILPGCLYCNFDHDPAIECRFKPENWELPERASDMEHTHEPLKERIDPKPLENGLQKASKLQYVAKHGSVLHGSDRVATARSNTFAKRIAKALNQLTETEKGEMEP